MMVNSEAGYAVVTIDAEGLIIGWDAGAKFIYGYGVNETTGKPIAILYTPETTALNDPQKNLELSHLNTTHSTNARRVNKNGHEVYVAVTCTAIFDAQKQLIAYSEVSHVVADERLGLPPINQSVDQPVRKDLLFAKLIENSHEGITLLDKNLKVIYRSRSAERMNGWNLEDRVKMELAQAIHPDDDEHVNALLHKVIASPGVPLTCSFRGKHRKGHYIWFESTFTNFLDDDGINAIVCNFKDISSKRKQMRYLNKR